jgi:hypothetical protein
MASERNPSVWWSFYCRYDSLKFNQWRSETYHAKSSSAKKCLVYIKSIKISITTETTRIDTSTTSEKTISSSDENGPSCRT